MQPNEDNPNESSATSCIFLSQKPKATFRERLARLLTFLFAFFALIVLFGGVYLTNFGIPIIPALGSSLFWGMLSFVARVYQTSKRAQREGRAVSKTSRRILDFSVAIGWLWITLAFLSVIDYLLAIAPSNPSTEMTMLSDLMVFDGVLIGFVSLLTAQDLRDLVADAESGIYWEPGLRRTYFHNRRLVKRRTDVMTLLFLLAGAFSSWLSIPWVSTSPNVGYFSVPVQVTVFGIGMLLGRMIWYV